MSILLIRGDARRIPLADNSINCCVTSPPYWGLRDYGHEGQLGLERTPEEYIAKMVEVFREVKRVLRDDGTCWVNMGDSYHNGDKGGYAKDRVTAEDSLQKSNLGANFIGAPNRQPHPLLKPKDLVGVPWMLAFALRADGWYLRSDIIWSKPNPMPESVTDRPTKAHEYIFLLSKSEKYYYNQDAILEPVSENTHMRLAQNLAAQIGSERANGGGKTNGNMKAVSRRPKAWDVDMGSNRTLVAGHPRKTPKQDQVGNRRYTGFNERWKVKYNDSFDAAVCLPVNERNKRTVWTVNVQGFAEAHFATFPEELIKPCILAGCPEGGVVLDPFVGSGTTLLVARNNQCNAVGIELSEPYLAIARRRLAQDVLAFV